MPNQYTCESHDDDEDMERTYIPCYAERPKFNRVNHKTLTAATLQRHEYRCADQLMGDHGLDEGTRET